MLNQLQNIKTIYNINIVNTISFARYFTEKNHYLLLEVEFL